MNKTRKISDLPFAGVYEVWGTSGRNENFIRLAECSYLDFALAVLRDPSVVSGYVIEHGQLVATKNLKDSKIVEVGVFNADHRA